MYQHGQSHEYAGNKYKNNKNKYDNHNKYDNGDNQYKNPVSQQNKYGSNKNQYKGGYDNGYKGLFTVGVCVLL